MSKKEYLNDLFIYLRTQEVTKSDISNVIEEYSNLYDEAIDNGLSDEEVRVKLGTAKDIYKALKGDLYHDSNSRNRIVALMPFVSVILFFLIGYLGDAFRYAWMVFLAIPITAILVNVKTKDKYVALTPFISTILFMLLGFSSGYWHPGWLVFLLVPVTAISLNVKEHKFTALSPFVVTVVYVMIGYFHPPFYLYGWALYAVVPLVSLLTKPITFKKGMLASLIVLAVIAHQLLVHLSGEWQYAWLVYTVPLLYAVATNQIKIYLFDKETWLKRPYLATSILAVIIIYLAVSLMIPDAWLWSWMILLFIPMIGIYATQKFKHFVAYTPFLSTIIFFSIGHFGGKWDFSWIVFLMIPIAGILSNGGKYRKRVDD